MRAHFSSVGFVALVGTLGCKSVPRDVVPLAPAPIEAAAPSSADPPQAPSAAHAEGLAVPSPAPKPISLAAPPPSAGWERESADAAAACRVIRGPIELPMHVPMSLALRVEAVDVILNEDGRPRVVALAAGPVPLGAVPVGREAAEGDRSPGLGVPCAVALDRVFCPDRSGQVHRSTRGETDDRVVASSRPSSRVSAAVLAPSHVALGYLASRQTSEGWMSEAWITVDDDPPVRASEEGSGATSLVLAPRGNGLLALQVDARTALTAMHARPAAYDKRLKLGDDAVIFVGGPGDRRTRATLAVPPSGPAWSLLPIAKDVGSFGLAIVRIDDPPQVDEPAVWAMYPNGLDPAPVAAAAGGPRMPAAWVALVRPQVSDPGSPRVLEIGELLPNGVVAVRDVVPTTGNASDVALVVDGFGMLWLAWVDAAGSWVERLACGGRRL
ncbi:MAG TPA: hypothetical protein VGL81_03295 [Polyangiaceae bacterium]